MQLIVVGDVAHLQHEGILPHGQSSGIDDDGEFFLVPRTSHLAPSKNVGAIVVQSQGPHRYCQTFLFEPLLHHFVGGDDIVGIGQSAYLLPDRQFAATHRP